MSTDSSMEQSLPGEQEPGPDLPLKRSEHLTTELDALASMLPPAGEAKGDAPQPDPSPPENTDS